jgi:hypothetical protein
MFAYSFLVERNDAALELVCSRFSQACLACRPASPLHSRVSALCSPAIIACASNPPVAPLEAPFPKCGRPFQVVNPVRFAIYVQTIYVMACGEFAMCFRTTTINFWRML